MQDRFPISKSKLIDLVFINMNKGARRKINTYARELFRDTTLEQRKQLDKLQVLAMVLQNPLNLREIKRSIQEISVVYIKKTEKRIVTERLIKILSEQAAGSISNN